MVLLTHSRMCGPCYHARACVPPSQELGEQVVLMIGCGGRQPDEQVGAVGLALLSRLVGCVANAHIASQVTKQRRGNVSVVLRGWAADKIEADWSDEESDEFCISPLA
jgi:hypothetical protein